MIDQTAAQRTDDAGQPGGAAITLDRSVVVELKDQLLMASTDMERLVGLLDHAVALLLKEFAGAQAHLEKVTLASDGKTDLSAPGQAILIAAMREHLGTAVTALQFHDMATQLIGHSVARMGTVTEFLGGCLMGRGGEIALVRFVTGSCPVAQHEMDAGSVELF